MRTSRHILVPPALLLAVSAWALWQRDLAAFQILACAPFLYLFVYLTVGAFAYRAHPDSAGDPDDDDAKALPFVSVLIPSRDEEGVIGHTLGHVLRMDYPRLEVIVIDDGSSDRTGEVARRFPVRVVTRLRPDPHGKAEALNAGLRIARGDVICVFDADSAMAPDFLRRAVAPLVADPGVCGVQGQVRMYNRDRNFLTRAQDDEFAIQNELLQLGRARLGGACALGGNGQLVRRSALEAVGGWSPSSLTEDLDLTLRLFLAGRGRIAHCTRAVVWQDGVPTFRALVRQRTRWAEGILRCYGEYAGPVLSARGLPAALRVDAFCALLAVFLPMLALASLLFSALDAVPGYFAHAFSGAAAGALTGLGVGAACIGPVVVSWKRDRRLTLVPVVRYALYILHWVPALACALGNVVRDRPPAWQKTAHARPPGRFAASGPACAALPAAADAAAPAPTDRPPRGSAPSCRCG